MASFVYTTKADRKAFIEADNQLEALRDIIKRERLNGYTGGIRIWSLAAWKRSGEQS